MADPASPADRHVGPVDIRVPPEPTLSRVLRLAASGLASLAGHTIDDIENIKVGVSEVLIALIEHGDGRTIDLQFAVEGGAFTVRGRTAVVSFDPTHPDLMLCRAVLAEVSDDYRIDFVDDHLEIWASVADTTTTE